MILKETYHRCGHIATHVHILVRTPAVGYVIILSHEEVLQDVYKRQHLCQYSRLPFFWCKDKHFSPPVSYTHLFQSDFSKDIYQRIRLLCFTQNDHKMCIRDRL